MLSTKSALREHIHRVACRARAFYAAKEPGHFLLATHFPVESPPVPPLHQFDLDRQLGEWLDHQLKASRPAWRAREGLDDDSIPSICPGFGIAEHSAWLGMDVHLQETTCLPVPMLDSPDDLGRLVLSPKNRWFQYMKLGYEHLRRRQDGSFVLNVRGTMAPMDIANAVRGNGLFTDFIDEPAATGRLMQFLVTAIRWYYDRLVSWADTVEGGHVFRHIGSWMEGRCLGHLSNDAAMLCSTAVYDEFGFPYERDLIDRYESAIYHVHNEKLHYVPQLASLPKLALLEVAQDPKAALLLSDLPRIFAATGSVALRLAGTSDEVRAHLEELRQRNVFILADCRDRADAEDLLGFVRDRSMEATSH
jgi:hypothetical protein